MRFRVGNKSETRIEGKIETLVTVSGPRISSFNSFDEMPKSRPRPFPYTKRTVDVYPRAMAFRNGYQRVKGIIRANVDIAGLQQEKCGNIGLASELFFERIRQ